MTDYQNDQTANFEFFKAAILEPALRDQASFHLTEDWKVADFGAVEAAHWARLGAQIGYFDEKEAQEVISSSKGVFEAWQKLQKHKVISFEENWAAIIRLEHNGHPELNTEWFSATKDIAPATRAALQQAFQIFLLLTREEIFVPDSRYFLDTISWSPLKEWIARRSGTVDAPPGSVQTIGFGFANVLNYWEEMDSSFQAVRYEASKNAQDAELYEFMQHVREILSRRFNLGDFRIVDRYFALAGEFVNRVRDDTPEWLDARRDVFEQLSSLLGYAGASDTIENEKEQLWNVYTEGVETALALERAFAKLKPFKEKGIELRDILPYKEPEPPKEFP